MAMAPPVPRRRPTREEFLRGRTLLHDADILDTIEGTMGDIRERKSLATGNTFHLVDFLSCDGKTAWVDLTVFYDDVLYEVAPISWTVCGLGNYVSASAGSRLAS